MIRRIGMLLAIGGLGLTGAVQDLPGQRLVRLDLTALDRRTQSFTRGSGSVAGGVLYLYADSVNSRAGLLEFSGPFPSEVSVPLECLESTGAQGICDAVRVPGQVTVRAGASSQQFGFETIPSRVEGMVTIRASLGPERRDGVLHLGLTPTLRGVSLLGSPESSPNPALYRTGSVTLDRVDWVGAVEVMLVFETEHPEVFDFPTSANIPQGGSQATFNVRLLNGFDRPTEVTVYAILNDKRVAHTVTLVP